MNLYDKLKRLNRYKETGRLLIPELLTGKILDAGCGENLYKIINPDIIGIDSDSIDADIITDIATLPFSDHTFDKVLCFGVFSEDKDTCKQQVTEVLRVIKPLGIVYLRCTLDHPAITFLGHLHIYKAPIITTNIDTGSVKLFVAYQNA